MCLDFGCMSTYVYVCDSEYMSLLLFMYILVSFLYVSFWEISVLGVSVYASTNKMGAFFSLWTSNPNV